MALLWRIKQVRLNYISQHLRICYFQTSVPQKAPYYYYHHHHTINQAIHQRPSDFFRQTVRFFAAPVQVKKKEEVKGASGVKLNEQIKAEFVRLVGDEGHSIVARHEALRRAKNLKLDLVEVDRHAKPPVCKIMDYHRERYKQQVKEKERTKVKSEGSIKKGDCKEVRFSAKTELKDLKMKADTVKRMMERGYRVKCMAMGTEDQDLGGLLSQISAMIEDVAIVDSGPRVERKQAYVIVRHVKFGSSKKGGKKAPKGDGDTSSEFQKAANACSQSPVDLEEESSSEEYATGNDDEADTPLQGQQQSAWSVSDANHAAFDKMFDLSHDMSGTSSSSSTEKHMKLAPSAVNSKAAGFSPSRVPNFKDPSQLEAENRYARNMTKNAPAARNPLRLPNYGNQPQSHSNFHPPEIEGSARNLRVPQNEIPRDRVGIPNQPSQFEPHSNLSAPVRQSEPPNSRSSTSQSSGFGIFNATEVDAPGKYGAGVGVNQHCSGSPSNVKRNLGLDNLNSPTVKSDGSQRSGNDDSGKWGLFSRENPNPIPGRSIQGEGKVQ